MSDIEERALQEFLEALAESLESEPEERKKRLLNSYAELLYGIHGGSRCVVCRAHVRHVLPVHSLRDDGTIMDYACLCQRCLEGEKALARRVRVGLGEAAMEFERPADSPQA